MKYFFAAFICVLLFKPLRASHVVGGDLSYIALGGDSFLVKLQLFRDCNSGGQIPSWKLNYKAIGGSASGSVTMNIVSKKDTQYSCRGNGYYGVCLQYVVQTAVIKLAAYSDCKWLLSVYECCRSNAVYNLSNPGTTGIYLSAELDKCISNSSPVFNPSAFDFTFSDKNNTTDIFTVTEPDGDSLVFAFEKAKTSGGSSASYKVTVGDTFYFDKPFGQKATLSLGLSDGELKANCGYQNSFSVVVGVTEYRKDTSGTYQAIGKTRKDMQLVNKLFVPNAPILSQASNMIGCSGDEICFKDMPTDDKDTSDSVYVSLQTSLPQGASFSTRWVGRHQYWTICWKTTARDTAKSPFNFAIQATDDGCFFPAITTANYGINVNPMPHIDRTFTPKGCGVYGFNAQSKYGYQKEKIYWDIGGISIGKNAYSFHYDFGDTGTFMIHSKVVYNKCEQEHWDTLKVYDYLKLELPVDKQVCPSTQVTIQTTVKGIATSFKWSIGNAVDTLSYLNVAVNSDTFFVCTAGNENCSQTDTIRFQLFNLAAPNKLYDTTVCQGQALKLNAFYGNGVSYLWNTGDTTSYITVKTAGQYIVKISGIGSTCFSYDTANISTYPLPDANFSTTKNGLSIDLLPTDTVAAAYLWQFGDGNTALDMKPSHTYTNNGNYLVELAITSGDGCSNNDSQLFSLWTGIAAALPEKILVWPNPFSEKLYLKVQKETEQAQLLDAFGRQAITVNFVNRLATIDTQHLPSGVYFLRTNTSGLKLLKGSL